MRSGARRSGQGRLRAATGSLTPRREPRDPSAARKSVPSWGLRRPALNQFARIAYDQSSPNLAFAATDFAGRVVGDPTAGGVIWLLRCLGFSVATRALPL